VRRLADVVDMLIGYRFVEGELLDMIEDFSEGRVQFAFVKVKDPNSGLPKYALIGWVCAVTHSQEICR